MRTITGDRIMAAYVAGLMDNWAGAIAVGIGNSSESNSQTKLDFEFARGEVNSITVDYGGGDGGTHRLIAKARLPREVSGVISEIGVYPSMSNPHTGGQSAMLSFGDLNEDWFEYSAGVFGNEPSTSDTDTKISTHSLIFEGGKQYRLIDFSIDLDTYSGSDSIVFATYGHTTVPTTIEWRFGVDDSNYFSYSDDGSAFVTSSQYKITEVSKASWSATGSPTWAEVNYFDVIVTGGGFTFDGARVEDMDTFAPDYGLVFRQKLSSPVRKLPNRDLEVEFVLDV